MGFLQSIGKLGKMAGGAFVNVVERLANKSEFEACMAAVVLVASADGKVSAEEETAAVGLLKSHPAFGPFDSRDIDRLFKEGTQLIGADGTYGRQALLDRVRAIKDPSSRARITTIALQIASADGDVDNNEKAVLDNLRAL